MSRPRRRIPRVPASRASSCVLLLIGSLLAASVVVNRHARATQTEINSDARRDGSPSSRADDGRSSAEFDPAYQSQRWGAIRSFHGLPSERVRAIAQDREGALWFGTDAGLARHDGRRTQTVAAAELPAHSVRALAVAEDDSLWVGTAAGAARRTNGVFHIVEATRGRDVRAILHIDARRTLLAVEDQIIECRTTEQGGLDWAIIATATRVDDRRGVSDTNAPRIEITSLAVAADGNIYAGTRGRGVLRIGHGSPPTEIAYANRSYYVEAARADPRGEIWFGAQTAAKGAGLQRLTDQPRAASAASIAASIMPAVERLAIETGTVRALAFDAAGDLWAGTGGRGVMHRGASGEIERWTFASTAGGLLSDEVSAVCIDREGVVWIGTDRGVCRYDPGAMRSETIARDPEANFVRVLRRTTDGKLLCGTNRGLYTRDDGGGGAWRRANEIGDATVYAIGEDDRRRTLVGTSRGLFVGVQAPAAGSAAIVHGTNNEPLFELAGGTGGAADRRDVRAIERFRGRAYLAVYGAGVELFDAGRRTPIVFAEASSAGSGADAGATFDARRVVSLRAEGDRRLWLGTTDGEVVCADDSHTPNDAAATGGAARTAFPTLRIEREPVLARLRGRLVSDIAVCDGSLWLATTSGLYVLLRDRELATVIEGVDVRAIAVSSISPATERDTPDDALAANAGVTTMRQQVWCATNGSGLMTALVAHGRRAEARREPARFDVVALSRFDVEHGLASSNAFAVLSVPGDDAARGALLVGTGGGVTRYTPAQIAPLLRLTRIGSRAVTDADPAPVLTLLTYPQNDLALEVAGVSSRTFPERFRYRFILRRADGEMIAARTAAEAQFTHDRLPPGDYRLEAQAFGVDLLASAPLVMHFEIAAAPFPWTIAWLSLLLASALGALVWGTAQNRRLRRTGNSLARANRELAAARLALATEAETERRRIARDLHDQTLADLRRLMLSADRAAVTTAAHTGTAHDSTIAIDPATLRAEVEAISGEVRRICEDLSPSVLENVGFVAALEWALTEACAQLPTEARFDFEFVCEPDLDARLRLTRAAQIQIYRIVQEVLSNVCRHAAATRVRLDVSLAPDDATLTIRIADNGRGFAPTAAAQDDVARRHAGRGMIGIHARALLVGAAIAYAPLADGGTLFTARVVNEAGA